MAVRVHGYSSVTMSYLRKSFARAPFSLPTAMARSPRSGLSQGMHSPELKKSYFHSTQLSLLARNAAFRSGPSMSSPALASLQGILIPNADRGSGPLLFTALPFLRSKETESVLLFSYARSLAQIDPGTATMHAPIRLLRSEFSQFHGSRASLRKRPWRESLEPFLTARASQ